MGGAEAVASRMGGTQPRLGARVVPAAELVENVGDERAHDSDSVGNAAARSGGVDDERPLAAPSRDADEATGEHRRGHRVFAATPHRVGQPVDSRGEERLGGLRGHIPRGHPRATGREDEARAVGLCAADGAADGVDVVGNHHEGRVDAVVGEQAHREGTGEVLRLARRAAIGDGDDARAGHVSAARFRADAPTDAREYRR